MPNFIAEWSGILIAVGVVDQLLERGRRAPFRAMCAEGIERALNPLFLFALSTGRNKFASEEFATLFYEGWRVHMAGRLQTGDTDPSDWLESWGTCLERCSFLLSGAKLRYDAGLDPQETISLQRVVDLWSREADNARRVAAFAQGPPRPQDFFQGSLDRIGHTVKTLASIYWSLENRRLHVFPIILRFV